VKTLAFYSYKGGAGRSLLLASTARYLAMLGHRVVAADFDFEAPGLHYKLNISPPGQRVADTIPDRGLVDYLLAAGQGSQPPTSLRPYARQVPLPKSTRGSLCLMPAGAAPTGDYWKALTSLLRLELFTDSEGTGIATCLEWKARVEEELEADFLLIDSPPGVNELAGVTTSVLADHVICLMLANRDSQVGARAVLRSLRHATRPSDQAPVEVIPVLSRVQGLDDGRDREALAFLNEIGATPEDTLSLDKIYSFFADPDLVTQPLNRIAFSFLDSLFEAEPAQQIAIEQRERALHDARQWLMEADSPESPQRFHAGQIDEGIQFEGRHLRLRETRYVDLLAYDATDRTDAQIAIEYTESSLAEEEARQWWERLTDIRCVVLLCCKESETFLRVLARGQGGDRFTELSHAEFDTPDTLPDTASSPRATPRSDAD
jgi:MinD-like ATPase involved in chromosome partitioning or flagellar assembly